MPLLCRRHVCRRRYVHRPCSDLYTKSNSSAICCAYREPNYDADRFSNACADDASSDAESNDAFSNAVTDTHTDPKSNAVTDVVSDRWPNACAARDLADLGEACAVDGDCWSGFCFNDGGSSFCCDSACNNGDCETCASGTGLCFNSTDLKCGAADAISCSTHTAGFALDGVTCNRYVSDRRGQCLATGACDTDVSLCDSDVAQQGSTATPLVCGSSECAQATGCDPGQLVSSLSLDDVCKTDVDEGSCPNIVCSNAVAGWVGVECHRFDESAAGYCSSTGTCLTNQYSYTHAGTGEPVCDPDAMATAKISECGSSDCKDLGKCVTHSLLSTSNTQAKVCVLETTVASCADLDCTDTVRGVLSNGCDRYGVDSVGFCNSVATCETSCSALVGQTRVTIQTCGSASCIKDGACIADVDAADDFDTLNELCYTDGLAHGSCGSGSFCDSSGTCVTSGQGNTCTVTADCGASSGLTCVEGYCCDSPCTSECDSCAVSGFEGTCTILEGDDCALSGPEDCTKYLAGWSAGDASVCLEYEGTTSYQCIDDLGSPVCAGGALLCDEDGAVTTTEFDSCGDANCAQPDSPTTGCQVGNAKTNIAFSSLCFVSQEIAACPNVACDGAIKGIDGSDASRCLRYDEDMVGYCDAAADCDTSFDVCSLAPSALSTAQHVKCTDSQCVRADHNCLQNADKNTVTLSSFCLRNAVETDCPTYPCDLFLAGFAGDGRTCNRYGGPAAGYCDNSGGCVSNALNPSTTSSRCPTATVVASSFVCASATCAKSCDVGTQWSADGTTPLGTFDLSDVCFTDTLQAGCPTITCASVLHGWGTGVNANTCYGYSRNHPGRCTELGGCEPSTAYEFCVAPYNTEPATSIDLVPKQTCADSNCKKSCVALSSETNADTRDQVCYEDEPRAACGKPLGSQRCDQTFAGWNGATCERYTVNSQGYCDASTNCITECADDPSMEVEAYVSCADSRCARTSDSCAFNDFISTETPVLSDFCYVDSRPDEGSCDVGATCNAAGACVFKETGETCTDDSECGGSPCVFRDPGFTTDFYQNYTASVGVCCTSACDDECNTCFAAGNLGICTGRTGEFCGASNAVQCSDYLKGFSGNQCMQYTGSRKGVCTSSQDGVCNTAKVLCATDDGGLGGVGEVALHTCTDSQCNRACPALALASLYSSKSAVCSTDRVDSDCPDIDCPSVLAGWDGLDCTIFTGSLSGFCDTDTSCTGVFSTCTDLSVATTVYHSCGSAACGGEGVTECPVHEAADAYALLSDVCKVNKYVAECAPIPCSDYLKGWNGRVCERYGSDRPGRCNGAADCDTAPARCSSNDPQLLSGVQHVACGSIECAELSLCQSLDPAAAYDIDNLCAVNRDRESCPDIACSDLIAGWDEVNERQCNRYTTDHRGFCDGKGKCTTDSTTCDRLDQTELYTCGSTECRREEACLKGGPVTSVEALNDVCFVDDARSDCPAVVCDNRLAGFVDNACMRYARSTSGHCDGTGSCITECKDVPLQFNLSHVACGSVGCVRPGTCLPGQPVSAVSSFADICFTSGNRDCPAGTACDETGSCVHPVGALKADGEACVTGSQCQSSFCVDSVCCNDECGAGTDGKAGLCKTCTKTSATAGRCLPLTGQQCGTGVCQQCDALGSCKSITAGCAEGSPFGCAGSDQQCVSGQCIECLAPPAPPPPVFLVPPPPPPARCASAGDCNFHGSCDEAGEACVCANGWAPSTIPDGGVGCSSFSCDGARPNRDFSTPYGCNEVGAGGTCIGPNFCACNDGFVAPNCLYADCSNVADCSGHGWCSGPDVCVCDEFFQGASCDVPVNIGECCTDGGDCDTGFCYAVGDGHACASSGGGVCCSAECDGECETCLAAARSDDGVCVASVGVPCGDSKCDVCNEDRTCGAQTTSCEDPTAAAAFGCDGGDDERCYAGVCVTCPASIDDCVAPAVVTLPLDQTGESVEGLVVGEVESPCGVSLSASTAQIGCTLSWSPNEGLGVACAGDSSCPSGIPVGVSLRLAAPSTFTSVMLGDFEGGDAVDLTLTGVATGSGDSSSTFEEKVVQSTIDFADLGYENVTALTLTNVGTSCLIVQNVSMIGREPTTTTTAPVTTTPAATTTDTAEETATTIVDNGLGSGAVDKGDGTDSVAGWVIPVVILLLLLVAAVIAGAVFWNRKQKATIAERDESEMKYLSGEQTSSFGTLTGKEGDTTKRPKKEASDRPVAGPNAPVASQGAYHAFGVAAPAPEKKTRSRRNSHKKSAPATATSTLVIAPLGDSSSEESS
eukprot:CAMPEP_0170747052 /NCGR_PEP_ID=MMETSP0437-20130122/9122_1 /TAXON_ID=0 /ORGANISM="Sexangularia sp." /LENGTH=2271 /DNA_ID=CAMNT_0011085815 /DNA_START=160 /DNA_END=6976 /DNA_ORIENTATION=-